MTLMKPTSQTRLVRNKYKLDAEPFRMSDYEWRGTLNDSELIVIIKYNLGAWKVKIAEIEDDLYIVDYIYAGQENSNIKNIIEKKVNINNIIEFLQWDK